MQWRKDNQRRSPWQLNTAVKLPIKIRLTLYHVFVWGWDGEGCRHGFGVFPGGIGVAKDCGLIFHPWLQKKHTWSFIHPSSPLFSPLPLPSLAPLGLYFPPLCLCLVFWILPRCKREDCPSFPTLDPRGHPISSWFGAEFLKHLRAYRIWSCPSS